MKPKTNNRIKRTETKILTAKEIRKSNPRDRKISPMSKQDVARRICGTGKHFSLK